jgi:hypothetical protein
MESETLRLLKQMKAVLDGIIAGEEEIHKKVFMCSVPGCGKEFEYKPGTNTTKDMCNSCRVKKWRQKIISEIFVSKGILCQVCCEVDGCLLVKDGEQVNLRELVEMKKEEREVVVAECSLVCRKHKRGK